MIKTINNLLISTVLFGLFISSCEKNEIYGTNDNNDSSNYGERQKVINEYNTYIVNNSVSKGYGWSGGDINSCTPGTLSSDATNKALLRINYFRRCVGLNDNIVFDPVKNEKCQQAALMQNANNTLNHHPPETWSCWTSEGYEASSSSNLGMGYSITGAIEGYMNDNGSGNQSVGHRRWILYSKGKTMGIGHTTNYNSLWVFSNNNKLPANMPEFISWPPEGYVPAPLAFNRWSFSIPSANFSNAQVEMTDRFGKEIPLTIVSNTDNGYGDNTIVWEPTSINKTDEQDITYTVKVNNVGINKEPTDYSYQVTIIQP